MKDYICHTEIDTFEPCAASGVIPGFCVAPGIGVIRSVKETGSYSHHLFLFRKEISKDALLKLKK